MAWVLFIRASACSPDRELCCLDWETGHRACTKKPFWYCWCSAVSLGLNWRKRHWRIQESRPNAENVSPLNSCWLLLRLACIFSQVVGVFHVVYCDDKKKKIAVLNTSWKTWLRRYANQIAFLLLSLTEFIQLTINISNNYMAKTQEAAMDAPVIHIFKLQGYIPNHWKYLFQWRYRLLKYGAHAIKHKL